MLSAITQTRTTGFWPQFKPKQTQWQQQKFLITSLCRNMLKKTQNVIPLVYEYTHTHTYAHVVGQSYRK